MTSTEIETNLRLLQVRIDLTDSQIKSADNLQRQLQLQRDLSDAESLKARLQSQLKTTQAAEAAAQEKREQDELDATLADLTAQANDIKADLGATFRTFIPEVERVYEALTARQKELEQLNREHETVYLKRHKDWPDRKNALIGGNNYLLPGVKTDGDTQKVLAFALQLFHNEKTKSGYSLADVDRGLSATYRPFNIF